MTTLNQILLDDLKKNTFPGLDFPSDFYMAAYKDQSILNIPSTICSYLDVPPIHHAPLRPEVSASIKGDVKRVILILMDALALHRFSAWLEQGKIPVWNQLLKSGSLSPITSISPATTSSAMTTFWTGHSTAEHGVAGYELWLKKYGVVANMVTQGPMSFKHGNADLADAGFDAETDLLVPKMGDHLSRNGIAVHSFQHYSIANSGLSRTYTSNATIHPFGTDSECWVNLREVIQKNQNEKQYIWTYWSSYDSLGHRYGPDDERSELYFTNFSTSLEEDLINRLTPQQRKGTLLLLTADHGQILTQRNPIFDVVNHPEFLNCLHIKPTGESRLTYLHPKPGKESTLRDYVSSVWPDQFVVMESKRLLDAGFFGPGTPMPDIQNRIGDLTMLAKGANYLWWSDEPNPLVGRHGGLSSQEMLVPYLAAYL